MPTELDLSRRFDSMVVRWFKPKEHTGWKKTQKPSTRRAKLLRAADKRKDRKGQYLEAGRKAQAKRYGGMRVRRILCVGVKKDLPVEICSKFNGVQIECGTRAPRT